MGCGIGRNAPLKLKIRITAILKVDAGISSNFRKQCERVNYRLKEKQAESKATTDGIVNIERRKILNEFPSEEVYQLLKKQLGKDFRKVQVE